MIKNAIKTGIRSLLTNKKFTLLNIAGLSISLAVVIIIALWITDELSFNKVFNNSNRVYELSANFDKENDQFVHAGPPPIAIYGKSKIPAIEEICRISGGRNIQFNKNELMTSEYGVYVDSTFNKVFDSSIKLLEPNKLFQGKQSIVITEKIANKYFKNENPLGKTLYLEVDPILKTGKQPFLITAVVNNFPSNSSLKADYLLPFELLNSLSKEPLDEKWGNFQYYIYFLLKQDSKSAQVAEQLTAIQKSNFQGNPLYSKFAFFLQKITQLNLYTPKGDNNGIQSIYIFAIIAFVILLVACINYVNLVTARATKRTKEISIRKIIGANRSHLFLQYLIESAVLFLISLFIATAIAYLSIPFFNTIAEKNIQFSLLSSELWYIFLLTFIATVFIAGIYPAVLFSSSKLLSQLKNNNTLFGNKNNLRKGLVVLQFCCTVILIVTTFIFEKQLRYMRNKDLGYDKENVFLFEQKNFLTHYEAVRNELQKQQGILGVTAASNDISNIGSETADIDWNGKNRMQSNFFISRVAIAPNFTSVLDIKLTEGNGFKNNPSDSSHALLNETAVKQMGLKNPIGQTITFQGKQLTIVGIMKDFNFNDLKTAIKPCIFFSGMGYALGGMYVKTSPGQEKQALSAVQKLWNKYNPESAFNYSFMDESFDKMYKKDVVHGKLVQLFAAITILLSCIGLSGLVLFSTEAKLKEIGIRKTLGASKQDIVMMIGKDYMVPVILSFLIAFPISWLIISNWLNNFVYRTSIDPWIFLLASLITILLVVLTAGSVSLKAAMINPTKILRDE
ncbi:MULTISPECIES: ABC transporter permease [Sphingobacterium]|uniref:ABC transporter permease n=1 Tax=Sphingobacterium athyrii TaxID=2152717 RepID=A0A363NMZ4_9SPHI|nr:MULTISPECIES: ABC transporter permease [Sphingobacterium]PUV22196.1 hypothetical protein DCO56_21765 [Sphingobacterium athyrii]QIH32258.1 FtsX-like permease family protein [Sphingobacterium sp. DR205]